jgi:hypothetical protein
MIVAGHAPRAAGAVTMPPGFAAQHARDGRLRSLGATPELAYREWEARRANPGAHRSTRPARKAQHSKSHADRLAALKRLARNHTPAPALQRTYRYRAGDKYVVHGLPHWPIMECTRNTDTRPGTSAAWRAVGLAA